MKYVHSMWSAPSKKDNFDNEYDMKYLNKNFYSYFLSALLIKKLGYQIDLYCDKDTAEIYSLIPYDKIHVIDFDSDGISSKFWIWGKIKTESLINEPFVHIDGDVFMFRDIIGNNISSGRYKAVVQQREDEKVIGHHFPKAYLSSKNPFVNLKTHNINWDKYGLVAYNCGVVGFSDMSLKNQYTNTVKDILREISNSMDFEDNRKKYAGMFLIAEQSLLYHILQERGIQPFEIIPYEEIKKRNYEWFPIASEKGYCHMWAYSKYKPDSIEKMKVKIEKFFPEYRRNLVQFEKKYLNK